MIFNSLAFGFFFVLVTGAYFLLPHRFRWMLLLVASCYFYMAFVPKYILILFYLILIDYIMGRRIEAAQGKTKRIYFLISIFANIGTLFVFKYFNFFNENVAALARTLHWSYPIRSLEIILPLGLSFHIFQSLSYVIEVYKGKQKAERHLGIYALYVMFFPQLVAGPIERPQNMLHQFHESHLFDPARFVSGLRLMAWGFFKKVVIADRLGGFVDAVYGSLPGKEGPVLLVAFVFYAFQIYGDFSGYSDIARGSARVLGYELTLNFNRPFFSRSIGDFWRRWHISLSFWFRDYLYFPLAYSAKKVTRTWLYACLVITFLVSGLWHGAGWTFIVWGGLHGIYLVAGQASKAVRERVAAWTGLGKLARLRAFGQILFTFFLACVSWVFFRATSFQDAWYVFSHALRGWGTVTKEVFLVGFTETEFVLSLVFIVALMTIEAFQEMRDADAWWKSQSLVFRSCALAFLVLITIVFGVFQSRGFIYFQF